MERIEFNNVQTLLDEFGREFVEDLKTRMVKGKKNATWNLYNSLRTTTGQTGDEIELDLHHLEYMQYVEYDTRPHWAPIQPLVQWVSDKKIPTRESTGNKKLPTEKQVAYMVQHKIAKEGTKGTGFIRELQIENFPQWKKRLQQAIDADVAAFMNQEANRINIKIDYK